MCSLREQSLRRALRVNGGVRRLRDAPPMDVVALLGRMANAYRSAAWYSDTGSAEVGSAADATRRRAVFTTRFVRDKEYSYTFEDQAVRAGCVPLRGFLRSSGDQTLVKDFGEVERVESLGVGIAGMGGGTDNVAYVIPALLFGDEARIGIWEISNLREPRFQRTEVATGAQCMVVTGIHPWNDKYSVTLFVDAESHLLRRVEQVWSFEGVETSSTILYEPAAGV